MRNKLVIAFRNLYPELATQMENTLHCVPGYDNPYHQENSVWTHTMMVMTYIDTLNLSIKDKKILLYTGLLHDIGKTKTLKFNEVKMRNSFHGHEGYSSWMCIEILSKLSTVISLTIEEQNLIFKLVSLHGTRIEDSEYRYLSDIFRLADKFGAIRDEEKDIHEQYPERKFFKHKFSNKSCTILTGLPNSGKSTYIKDKNFDFILSRDTAIEEFYYITYKKKATYNQMFEISVTEEFNTYFNSKIREAREYDNIVVDMTMVSLKSRRTMMNSLGDFDFKSVVCIRDLSLCKSNIRPGKDIPGYVFDSMMSAFTFPIIQEGFSSISIERFKEKI